MTFAGIPPNVAVFVDANTFVYHFSNHPVFAPACTQLLDRCARQEILGFTSADVLSDVAHRLMVLEASVALGWTGTGMTQRLRRHPMEIQRLLRFRQAVQQIPLFGIRTLPITASLVEAATAVSQGIGLLSGDALIVAVMQDQGLTHLASNDADFDRVPGVTRYAPA
jgi:predicted nucleic acid-binding protein